MLGNDSVDAANHPLGKSPEHVIIVAYGGCTVTGYPLPEEASFVRQAAKGAQAETATEIGLEIIGITACPATKALEQLEEKVLSRRPDIVVLQFGQSDAKVAVKRRWHEAFGRTKLTSRPPVLVSVKPMTARDRVKAFVLACAGLIVGAQPATLREDYRRSIAGVVEAVVATGAYAIVLTPFVFENFLADAWARCFSCDLEADFAGRTDVCVINVWKLLAEYPRTQMLLHDGLHLAQPAHEILAESLQACLVEWIRSRASVP